MNGAINYAPFSKILSAAHTETDLLIAKPLKDYNWWNHLCCFTNGGFAETGSLLTSIILF